MTKRKRFRLSKAEFFAINRIYNTNEIGCVMCPQIYREWERVWKKKKYPYRKDIDSDEGPVIGVIIGMMPI
jgi:hypothetical protein